MPRSETDRPTAPEPRQRWRLVVARARDAPAATQRETSEAWEAAIEDSGLPVVRTPTAADGPGRPRITFGAPSVAGIAAERELIDIVLFERLPAWIVREGLDGHLPPGWRLIDLHDVWLAGPPLAGQVAAADYRITLDLGVEPGLVARAAATIRAASALPRQREKGSGLVRYDLRPLLLSVVVAEDGPPVVVNARTRIHPQLGTGRPEEVIAALADAASTSLSIASIVRERLIVAEDLPDDPVGDAPTIDRS